MGASKIMSLGEAICFGLFRGVSQDSKLSDNLRWERLSPTKPAFGLAPLPVAEQSRISPPLPVAAPSNGEMPVGWLCVSTFIVVCTLSSKFL